MRQCIDFPRIHATVDWSRGYEILSNELQAIASSGGTGRRSVDELVKVWLIDGEEAWLLRPQTLELFAPAKRVQLLEELLWRRTIGYAPIIPKLVDALSSTVTELNDQAGVVPDHFHTRVANRRQAVSND